MAECLSYEGSGGGVMPTFTFVDLSWYLDSVHLGYAFHEHSQSTLLVDLAIDDGVLSWDFSDSSHGDGLTKGLDGVQ
jgi:hypothetical protein